MWIIGACVGVLLLYVLSVAAFFSVSGQQVQTEQTIMMMASLPRGRLSELVESSTPETGMLVSATSQQVDEGGREGNPEVRRGGGSRPKIWPSLALQSSDLDENLPNRRFSGGPDPLGISKSGSATSSFVRPDPLGAAPGLELTPPPPWFDLPGPEWAPSTQAKEGGQ